ncbi:hypothetical protein M2451_001709 [Dysgonomonas sp. PFB1-18]|uniref:RCC1 domain-containing protein n=1 Tax=unclassified Dysgonomonas TaxID=2630389 RepID=UPI00247584FC|nr:MULTISPECIES: hypothetical protein [unclassified Dysgonomonas]MDH6309138.1 hypothetical protein [Dysgonomonas sp. PF1-14]MDH6338982.1 hypothetical protein [Dysgonomonas sp. PF1-16]MDH6380387.1 hypothetical protein [Dysgonomonas sp. PFB1-18]MDH6397810.1 hypothetical protein [Dysgonomonas sp. PF1-23]
MNKIFNLLLLLFISSLSFAQVGIGTNVPANSGLEDYTVKKPKGALHLQGVHFLNDSVNRNLGFNLPVIDTIMGGDIRIINPQGGDVVPGTIVFDKSQQGIRLRGTDYWENALVDNSSISNYFDFDIFGGLNIRTKKVSAGYEFSLVIGQDDNAVYATGLGSYGRLGTGSATNATTFTLIFAAPTKDISAGYLHGLLATESGELWSWGNGGVYRTGLGVTQNRVFPQKVRTWAAGKVKAVRVEAGWVNSLVLGDDGKVYSFGGNTQALNGNGTITGNITTPTVIASLAGVKDISLSQYSAAALTEDGKMYVWGNTQYGRLGTGVLTASYITPQQILSSETVEMIAMGCNHGLAVTSSGKKLFAWGATPAYGILTTPASPMATPQDVTIQLNGGKGLEDDEYIISIAASRFDGTSNIIGSSIVITNKNIYAAGNTTQAQRMGLGYFKASTVVKFSPGSNGAATSPIYEAFSGFQPLYDKAIYSGTLFDAASIGYRHSLLRQTVDPEDNSGGYGYGMGYINYNQLGAMDSGIGIIAFPVLLKK